MTGEGHGDGENARMSAAAALLADCQKRLERSRGGGGWFTSGGGRVDHGTYRSVVAPYHDRVYFEGRVAWAALVMAQPALYALGDWDSTGTVVYSFDRFFDANPQHLERIAASVGALKNAMPKDALLVAFAAEVRNDQPREIDRLVPVALTQGRQVRYETIYVQRHRLPTGYLAGQFFPIIISTSQPTQPMLLPLEEWSPDLVEVWKVAGRKKPPAAAAPIQRTDRRTFDQAYNDAAAMDNYGSGAAAPPPPPPPPPAARQSSGQGNSSLQFGPGASAPSSSTYGGNAYRPPAYVDPYTAPSNTYGNGRAFDSSPHAYVQQNNYAAPAPPPAAAHAPPPPPPPPPPVIAPAPAPPPARSAPRLDPAAEAFARNPLQLTPAAIAGLRLSAKQQSMDHWKVRVSAADHGHRIDFVGSDPDPSSDFVYDSGGVTVVIDVNVARKLTGAQVDFGPSPNGVGFFFRRVA
jgi:Fe-S cluster assembly iron-binding protein IscA